MTSYTATTREWTHPKNKSVSGRLYKNKWLEEASRTSIYVPIILDLLIITSFLTYNYFTTNSLLVNAVLFITGILLWTFIEYWVHRSLYHCETKLGWLKKLQYNAHHVHHEFPRDHERLAMPPLPAIILFALIFGVFYLISGNYAFQLFPGFVFGYMYYVTLHYLFHRYRPPRFKPLRKLWVWHALHHYKYPDSHAFGVSTRLWDFVFKTAP